MMNTLREIANLSVSPGIALDLQVQLEHKTEQILQSLNRIWALTEFSQFESFPRTKDEQRLVRHIRAGLPTVRAVLLARTGLLHHCLVQSDCHPTGVASRSQQYCTHNLLMIVSRLDDDRAPNPPESKSELSISFSKTPNVNDESNEHSTEVVLSLSLMFLTDQLQALFV